MGSFIRWLVVGLMCASVSVAHAEGGWKLAKDEDGIQVYLKPITGSSYKAYRGVTTIRTDLKTLRGLQENVAKACEWVHECEEQKLLKHEGATAWTYSKFNTPWPVTPRDSVVKVTTREAGSGALRRELEGVPGYIDEQDGFVRVSKVEGYWLFEPKPDGEVQVTYQVHTEPGGSVPSWLANKFVVEAPFNTLLELRKRAEQH
jgi:hypothetical protein